MNYNRDVMLMSYMPDTRQARLAVVRATLTQP